MKFKKYAHGVYHVLTEDGISTFYRQSLATIITMYQNNGHLRPWQVFDDAGRCIAQGREVK